VFSCFLKKINIVRKMESLNPPTPTKDLPSPQSPMTAASATPSASAKTKGKFAKTSEVSTAKKQAKLDEHVKSLQLKPITNFFQKITSASSVASASSTSITDPQATSSCSEMSLDVNTEASNLSESIDIEQGVASETIGNEGENSIQSRSDNADIIILQAVPADNGHHSSESPLNVTPAQEVSPKSEKHEPKSEDVHMTDAVAGRLIHNS
jgi:hypothetical protein